MLDHLLEARRIHRGHHLEDLLVAHREDYIEGLFIRKVAMGAEVGLEVMQALLFQTTIIKIRCMKMELVETQAVPLKQQGKCTHYLLQILTDILRMALHETQRELLWHQHLQYKNCHANYSKC